MNKDVKDTNTNLAEIPLLDQLVQIKTKQPSERKLRGIPISTFVRTFTMTNAQGKTAIDKASLANPIVVNRDNLGMVKHDKDGKIRLVIAKPLRHAGSGFVDNLVSYLDDQFTQFDSTNHELVIAERKAQLEAAKDQIEADNLAIKAYNDSLDVVATEQTLALSK
jgi:hypothetical protein